jgi:CyaY protein
MNEQEFKNLASECLTRVENWAEDFDVDEMDYDLGDGLMKLEFPDGVRFVLNRQAGNHQMWLAAGVRAWHYDWDAERQSWFDDRDGHEFYARVREVVAEKLGRDVPEIGA